MRMSSGIMINAPSDPDYENETYADHFYLYTSGGNNFHYAATRPLEYPPNTVGRYRNTDPVLTSYLIRLAVEGRGEDYHSFPQRNLFDKIGIRNALVETDTYGNFLGQGLAFMSARDWARLGIYICKMGYGMASESCQKDMWSTQVLRRLHGSATVGQSMEALSSGWMMKREKLE